MSWWVEVDLLEVRQPFMWMSLAWLILLCCCPPRWHRGQGHTRWNAFSASASSQRTQLTCSGEMQWHLNTSMSRSVPSLCKISFLSYPHKQIACLLYKDWCLRTHTWYIILFSTQLTAIWKTLSQSLAVPTALANQVAPYKCCTVERRECECLSVSVSLSAWVWVWVPECECESECLSVSDWVWVTECECLSVSVSVSA